MSRWQLSAKILIVLVAAECLSPWTGAQEKSVRPGINKQFEKPDVKNWLGKFEGESREIFTQRQEIVAKCKLKPGMVVADVGAGTGLFTRLFAREVGPDGKVFAVDIAPRFLEHIAKTCKEAGVKNVSGVVCTADHVKLAPRSVDLVFICDTYHHFEFPHRTLTSIHEALRPGGQIVLIDFHRIEGKTSKWLLDHVRAGQEIFVGEIKSAGFKVVGEDNFLKENYFVRFAKKPMRSLEQFLKDLDKNLTPARAAAIFGEPDRRLGSGLIIFEYDLNDGTGIRFGFPGFAPIQYAHHVQKDGKFVVIPVK